MGFPNLFRLVRVAKQSLLILVSSLEARNELTPIESTREAALLALLLFSQTLFAWVELLDHRSEFIEVSVVIDWTYLDAFQTCGNETQSFRTRQALVSV